MKQKNAISNLLMTLLVVCTIMYQSVHSVSHVLHELEQVSSSDFPDSDHHHFDSKHCYVCDFTFSPFTQLTFETFTFFNPQKLIQSYAFSEQTVHLVSYQHNFLRGPPLFI